MTYESYIETVEAKDWGFHKLEDTLYAIPGEGASEEAVDELEEDAVYMLFPRLKPGQSLAEAIVENIGACLWLHNFPSSEYLDHNLVHAHTLALFTHFVINEAGVHLFTPPAFWEPDVDRVVLNPQTAETTFRAGFDIIGVDQFEAEVEKARPKMAMLRAAPYN